MWFGLFAPPGTPAAVVQRVNAEMNKALRDKEVLDVLTTNGMVALGGSADMMKTMLQKDTVRWGPVVKASGATVD